MKFFLHIQTKLFKVLTALVENALQKQSENQAADTPLQTLCRHVEGWTLARVYQVLRYCRDWNTRARNSEISMLIVRAIFTCIPVVKLASNGDHGNIPELLAGITPYAERHLDRLDKLFGSSFMIDFVLHSMGKGLDDVLEDEEHAKVREWETKSKFVLPPDKKEEERIQLKGVVKKVSESEDENDEVVTIGDSDTESESGSDEEMDDNSKEQNDGETTQDD